ncbi:MAG: HAD-IA family hydrolase [Paramuribaculum sp.]|nr:HAD-IA family hydrolase [Paramuribaculum sp.]
MEIVGKSRLSEAVKNYLQRINRERVDLQAALIDMDGTLYDSMPRHAEAWRLMTSELGITLPIDDFFRFEGRTGASTINIIFQRAFGRNATEREVHDLYERKKELFNAMPSVSVMPGAQRMINILKSAGVMRVLVTGSGQNTLLNRLNTDFPEGFSDDLRVTSRDVKIGKPSPEPYLKAMSMAGVLAWQCIVIENAPLGVESGHAAGIFTIGVTTGPLKSDELMAAGADITFDSMTEFADRLPDLITVFNSTYIH